MIDLLAYPVLGICGWSNSGKTTVIEKVLRDLAENVAADDWSISILEEVDPETADIRPQSDYRKSAPDGA